MCSGIKRETKPSRKTFLSVLANFQMAVARDEHDQKLLSDVAKYGSHVVHIFAGESGPAYTFSVGALP
jgi:hypothetical protein